MARTRTATEGDATEPTETPERAAQRSIQSVEIGFRLINALERAPDALTLKDLAAAAGMTASKAHLYLVSFRRVGLVAQEPDSGRYTLGGYALQLGLASLRKLDVARLSREALRDLASSTGEACYLAVWGNRGPCIIQRVDGPGPLPMSLQVGYVLPAIATATGRIFLAYLPRARTEQVVAAERAVAWSEATTDGAMARVVEQVRAQGIARTDGQLNAGFSALSAPIFSHDGSLAAALTVIGPSTQMNSDIEGPVASRLREVTQDLSRAMGWSSQADSPPA
jgi:DNA-binding IclR family transcriptional regulator